MSAFYGNINEAAELAGVETTKILGAIKTQVNGQIDANILHGRMVGQTTQDEFYDIDRDRQKELILLNSPVVSVATLTNDAQNSTPTIISATDYVLENRTGIIKLLQKPLQPPSLPVSLGGFGSVFTKGFHSVRVQYTSGYAVVPEIIQSLATLMAARWAKIQSSQAGVDGLKQIKAGDYTETYDITGLHVRTEFDAHLKMLMKQAKMIFNKGV